MTHGHAKKNFIERRPLSRPWVAELVRDIENSDAGMKLEQKVVACHTTGRTDRRTDRTNTIGLTSTKGDGGLY